MPIGDGKMTSA